MQFNPQPDSVNTFQGWPVTMGLAVLLALTGAARWKLGALQEPPRASAPVLPGQDAGRFVRVAVASDGSITVASDGKNITLDDLTLELRAPAKKTSVELSVDPRARGAAVDALLNRLRDSGVSQCTLLVDLASATASGPESSRTRVR
jgi:biopolymer transport protein ExbD